MLFALVLGGLYFFEDRFAKAGSLRKVDGKLDYHLVDVRFTSVRDRLWRLKTRYGENCPSTRKRL